MLAIGLGVVYAFMPVIEPHMPRIVAKYLVVVLFLVCLIPYFVWKTYRPPAFDITAGEKSVDYEFRSAAYAIEFANLNEDDVEAVQLPF